MSAYTKPGNWCRYIGGIRYQSLKDLPWEIGKEGSELVVTVPAGTPFDVSVWKPLRIFFSPHDSRFLKAAALHDYLLISGWNRVTAGAVFHEALIADGVPRVQRMAMWLAVSLFKYK